MTDNIISELELEAQRATVRTIRSKRMAALGTFIAALGYDPDDVRSLQVINGSIRLHVFVKDATGKKAVVTDSEGREEAPVIERTLAITQADLDEDEAIQRFLSGE